MSEVFAGKPNMAVLSFVRAEPAETARPGYLFPMPRISVSREQYSQQPDIGQIVVCRRRSLP